MNFVRLTFHRLAFCGCVPCVSFAFRWIRTLIHLFYSNVVCIFLESLSFAAISLFSRIYLGEFRLIFQQRKVRRKIQKPPKFKCMSQENSVEYAGTNYWNVLHWQSEWHHGKQMSLKKVVVHFLDRDYTHTICTQANCLARIFLTSSTFFISCILISFD